MPLVARPPRGATVSDASGDETDAHADAKADNATGDEQSNRSTPPSFLRYEGIEEPHESAGYRSVVSGSSEHSSSNGDEEDEYDSMSASRGSESGRPRSYVPHARRPGPRYISPPRLYESPVRYPMSPTPRGERRRSYERTSRPLNSNEPRQANRTNSYPAPPIDAQRNDEFNNSYDSAYNNTNPFTTNYGYYGPSYVPPFSPLPGPYDNMQPYHLLPPPPPPVELRRTPTINQEWIDGQTRTIQLTPSVPERAEELGFQDGPTARAWLEADTTHKVDIGTETELLIVQASEQFIDSNGQSKVTLTSVSASHTSETDESLIQMRWL